jgi:hypothetical protein
MDRNIAMNNVGLKLVVISLVILFGQSTHGMAEAVGKMTAVQTEVRKSDSGVIGVGAPISLGDELRSNSTGLGMIVFKDESSAKLGPNSRLTIDEFVYSPGSSGALGISMDRGVSRFYGGQVSKKGAMNVSTPHVILGVRGGIVEVNVGGGKTVGVLRAGKLTCSNNGVVRVITKPGFACISDGSSLSVARSDNSFKVLDSISRIAGTSQPGAKGPGIEVEAGCLGAGASSSRACVSRNGQLPDPGSSTPRIPEGSPEINRQSVGPNF